MATGFTKLRGTTFHIGTTAANHLTDTYTEIEGCKMLGGTPGKNWSRIDITTLKDVYKQETKGVADGGTIEIGGILESDPAIGQYAAGIKKLAEAADQEEAPDVYNFKMVRPNGMIAYYKCRVMSFTTPMGTNANIHEYRSILTITADVVLVAAA